MSESQKLTKQAWELTSSIGKALDGKDLTLCELALAWAVATLIEGDEAPDEAADRFVAVMAGARSQVKLAMAEADEDEVPGAPH